MASGTRKTRIGRVVRNRMDKTVVVAVEWRQPHPLYRKQVKKVANFHAHDEDNACSVGDWVNIIETRPLSKTKRWRVAQILTQGGIPTPVEVPEPALEETGSGEEQQVQESDEQEKEEEA
jgi:small subunit ribosomal protein S17